MSETKEITPPKDFSTPTTLEAEWFRGIADYLYTLQPDYTYKTDIDGNLEYHPDSLVTRYKEYQKSTCFAADTPGALVINDIIFSIPPQNINVSISEKSIDIPQIRSKHSVQLDTGYGEVSINISLVFADNLLYPNVTLENELNFKLIPLLIQLQNIPFCQVDNDYLRQKLIQYSEELTGQTVKDADYQSIMLTYVNHSISTSEESPRIIHVDFSFLLFNYLPFTQNIAYVRKYDRTNPNLIDRKNGLIQTPTKGAVYSPADSNAFYEFNTPELKRFHNNFYDPGLAVHENNLEFTWYEYIKIPKSFLNKEELRNATSTGASQPSATISKFSNSVSAIGGSRLGRLKTVEPIIDEAAQKYNVDKNLIKAIITRESNAGHPDYMVSDKLCKGWMQLKDSTATWLGVSNSMDTRQNIMGGTKYLAFLLKLFSNDMRLAIAAYNCGQGTVIKYKGVPPIPETQTYLKMVLGYYNAFNSSDKSSNTNIGPSAVGDVATENLKPLLEKAIKDGAVQNEIFQQTAKQLQDTPAITNQVKRETDQQIEQARIKLMATPKAQLDAVLKLIPKDNWEYVVTDSASVDAYIRLRRAYNPYMHKASGIKILGVQCSGGQNIPRIPISGYRYATHQYMGGHISKFVISLITYPISVDGELINTGDQIIANMQHIFNQVSQNNISHKNIASLDGIGIKNGLINTLMRSQWFTLDNTDIQTHPDIPGGSIVTLTFTDYSRVKEYASKAFKFQQEYVKNTRSFINEIVKTAFSEAKPFLDTIKIMDNSATVLSGNYDKTSSNRYVQFNIDVPQNLSAPFRGLMKKLTEKISAVVNFEDGIDDTGFKILSSLRHDTTRLYYSSQLKASGGGRTIENNSTQRINKKDQDIILESFYKLIPGEPNKKPKTLTDLVQYCFNGKSKKLYDVIYSWANLYLDDLIKFTPGISAKYTDTAIADYERVSKPAYLDYDLPPGIDPDYYFYQGSKYSDVDAKKTKLWGDDLEKFKKTLDERWKSYDEQLRATQFWDKSNTKQSKNILYQLIGELDAKSPEGERILPTMAEADLGLNEYLKLNDGAFRTTRNIAATNNAAEPLTDGNVMYLCQNLKKGEDSLYLSDKAKTGREVNTDPKTKPQSIEDRKKSLNENTPSLAGLPLAKEFASMDDVDKTYKRYLMYSDHESYMKALFSHHANKGTRVDYSFDLLKCFPVHKIFILEEDDQSVMYPLIADFNDYYGLNAITEIRFVEHSDQPADLLMIRFLDITGRFTSARFKEYMGMESKTGATIDTEAENPLKGVMIKEGTRIQFRAGYSNDVNKLDTKFNGQVVSIEGDRNEFTLICQSFGTELVYDKKSADKTRDITSFNAETKEILHWCVTQPEVKHFGRWKLTSLSNMQFSKDNFGLNLKYGVGDNDKGTGPGYYIRQRADGSTQRTWSFTKDEADVNIISPDESVNIGVASLIEGLLEHPVDAIIDQAKDIISLDLFKVFTQVFTSYYVHGQTLWDIIDEMTYRYPGYVAKVLPYDDRATLYYGPLDAPYFYRSYNIKEMREVSKRINTEKTDFVNKLENAIKGIQESEQEIKKLQASPKSSGTKGGTANLRQKQSGWRGIVNQLIVDQKKRHTEDSAKSAADFIREEYQQALNTVKPFRKFIVAASDRNIITNNIKADYRDVYNQVTVPYMTASRAAGDIKDRNYDGTVTVSINDFLSEEDLRTTTLDFPNVVNEEQGTDVTDRKGFGGAYRYAVHELWRQSKGLYKGSLNLVGDPSIRPYDTMLLYDYHSDTYGPVEVKEHILTITPGEGMISSVTPSMYSNINDMTNMGLIDTLGTFLATDFGIDAGAKISYGILPAASFGAAVYNTGAILAGSTPGLVTAVAQGGLNIAASGLTSLGFPTVAGQIATGTAALGPVGWGVAAATAISFYSLGRKLLMIGKYREPIFLQPLMRNGIPYIVGMNHYKIGTTIEYFNHEWQIFTDGLKNFYTMTEYALDAINGQSTILFGDGDTNKQ